MKFFRVLILFLFFKQFIIAQEFKHLHYNTNSGLPSSEVYSIIQDSKGYIWFATDHGVCRYNGKNFTTYTIAEGLPDNTIFRMCEDPQGRIWFASQSNELCYWDKGVIHQTPASVALHNMLASGGIIKDIYIDSLNTIWINTQSFSAYSEAKTNYSKFQRTDSTNLVNFNLIAIDKKHVQYGLTYNHSRKQIDPNNHLLKIRTYYFNHPKNYQDYTISAPDRLDGAAKGMTAKGDFLLGIDKTLYIFSKEKIIQKNFKKTIIKIVTDAKNNIWVCYIKGGVDYFKNGDLTKTPVSLFTNYSVDDICLDHEGGVWAATLENGAFYMPSTSIFVYTTPAELNDHIIYLNAVNDTVIINTFGENCFYENDQKVIPLDWINKTAKTKGALYHVLKARDTTYYSFSKALLRYDSLHRLIPYPADPLKIGFSGGKKILYADNSIWLLSGPGLRKLNNATHKAEFFITPYNCSSAITVGNDILVGTKKGLYLLKDKKYRHLNYIDPLLNSPVISITKDKDSAIWIATTGNGVLRLKDNKITQISKKDGLVSTICTAISIDQYGNIWVGTNNGLSCIRAEGLKNSKWKIKNITEQTGLNSNDITKVYAFKEKLWVGTMNGISCVDINDVLKAGTAAPAHIDSIKVNNVSVSGKHVFSYNENNLKIMLDGLTFNDNGNHKYRYRLIGLDSIWQQTNTDEILISNLAPGQYIFEAQVANADNIWSTKSSSYSFTIEKPFWLTWWFILLEIILLIVIVYLIILWRTNIIQKKENEKVRINKLLAEYQMKALTAQMNPHFIFNAINSIQNFIIQNHATLAYDYLIKFSKLIRLVLNNSKENEISLKQELDTLSLYIELEQLRFEQAFTFTLHVEPEIDQESLMIPALLLQPYIENAIWHGLMPLKTRPGIISLTIIQQADSLKITISDNGVGRAASDQIKKKIVTKTHQSVGMELTGKRIQLFGQDSKFSLQIIDNYNEHNEPTGTTVEIVLPMVELY